jgi:hypothetical protein
MIILCNMNQFYKHCRWSFISVNNNDICIVHAMVGYVALMGSVLGWSKYTLSIPYWKILKDYSRMRQGMLKDATLLDHSWITQGFRKNSWVDLENFSSTSVYRHARITQGLLKDHSRLPLCDPCVQGLLKDYSRIIQDYPWVIHVFFFVKQTTHGLVKDASLANPCVCLQNVKARITQGLVKDWTRIYPWPILE